MSPSEYLYLPRESIMKEKLEVKLATFPEFLSQRCICSEYVARPQLYTSSGVSWIIEPEFVALLVGVTGLYLVVSLKSL